jgi:hypothetical protein
VQSVRLLLGRIFGEGLEQLLQDKDGVGQVVAYLANLAQLPQTPPLVEEADAFARRFTEKALALVSEARESLAVPSAWKHVGDILRSRCEQILAAKLPNTLTRVWLELVWALSPARWVVPAKPFLEISSRRKLRRLNVTAQLPKGEVLARYFFNTSENHILGLAWFFIRYATDGRFEGSFLVLDDPAQEMDQTTYSSFARFIGAFARVHRTRGIPITLLVLMHQEERALELARSTDALIHILSWSPMQGDEGSAPIRRMKLTQQGVGLPSATGIFGKEATNPV